MKTGIFFARVWNFLRKIFFPISESVKEDVALSKIKKIEDEEVLAENMIKNNQERTNTAPVVNDFYIPEEKLVFVRKLPDSEEVKVKKSRRILTYKIETKDSIILFEGEKISKFIEETKPKLPFTKRQLYRFAEKYQDTKLFKKGYFVSFKEVIK